MLVLALGLPLFAEEATNAHATPASWLSQLAHTDWQGTNTVPLRLPPDGRLYLFIGFKTCCLANQIAVSWVVKEADQWGDSLGILGLSLEPPRQTQKVKAWLNARKFRFPYAIPSSGDLRTALGLQTAPAVILIGPNGSELYRTIYFTTSDGEKIERLIASYYNKKTTK